MRRLFLATNAIISIIIIAVILHLVGLGEVVSDIRSIKLEFLALGLLSLFAVDLIMCYRIHIMLSASGGHIDFVKILKSHFVGMLMADFTPSRTGYFATAAALKYNHDVPSEKALLSIFGPQIFDFVFKIIVGSLGILYLMYLFSKPGDGIILISGILIILLVVAVMLLLLFSKRFLGLFAFAKNLPLLSRLYEVLDKMQDKSHVVLDKSPHIIALILAAWNFRALSWFFAAKAVGISIDAPFPDVLVYYFLQPLVSMLEFIPSPTIAGLGISEGGSTLVLSILGVSPAAAALFALVARFQTTLLHLPAVPEALRVPRGIKALSEK